MTLEEKSREASIEYVFTAINESVTELDAGVASTMSAEQLLGAVGAGCTEQITAGGSVEGLGTLAAACILTLARLVETGQVTMTSLKDERSPLQ